MHKTINRIAASTIAMLALVTSSGVTAANATSTSEVTASKASATACWRYSGGSLCEGRGTFKPYGEHLLVHDLVADGHGTRAQIQTWHHPTSSWVNHSSSCFDDTSTGGADGVADCNYSLAEGTIVRVHVWASDGAGVDYYSESTKA